MVKLHVPNMSCGHCSASIEEAVLSFDADALIAVDLKGRTVEIDSDAGASQLIALIKSAGFEATAA